MNLNLIITLLIIYRFMQSFSNEFQNILTLKRNIVKEAGGL